MSSNIHPTKGTDDVRFAKTAIIKKSTFLQCRKEVCKPTYFFNFSLGAKLSNSLSKMFMLVNKSQGNLKSLLKTSATKYSFVEFGEVQQPHYRCLLDIRPPTSHRC